MTRVQMIEHEIKRLDRSSLAAFRDWFRKFDSDRWDRQIDSDVRSGKLQKFAREAIAAHKNRKTREI